MHITPLECNNCGRKGRPDEEGFQSQGGAENLEVHCNCGNKFPVSQGRDQLILSANVFSRLDGASNHCLYGVVMLTPGHAEKVVFDRPFDFPCRAFLTPNVPIYVKELDLKNDGMTILSSCGEATPADKEVKVGWTVYGLGDMDGLPLWYVHFYSAITHWINGLYSQD